MPFFISTLVRHLGDICYLLYPLMSSFASNMLSAMRLPGINPDWAGITTLLITRCSLCIKIFEIILFKAEQQAIGL